MRGFDTMSVIALADWPKQLKERVALTASAELIIFPGVRRERLVDDEAIATSHIDRKARLPNRNNQATAEELE